MKQFFLFCFVFFLFSAPSVQADFFPSCEALEKHITITENEKLTTLLTQQQSAFFQAAQNLESFKDGECDTFSIKKYQDLLKAMNGELFFGIENFLGSSSSFYNNSCQQKDSEKLLMLLDIFETTISENIQQCKKVEPLIEIKNQTALFMQYVRDKDERLENNTIQNKPFSYYWNEELYKNNSLSCPSESWKEVSKEWCTIQKNWKGFQSTAKKMVGLESLTKEEKQHKADKEKQLQKQAQSQAETYIRANLPDFLALKNQKNELKESNKKDGIIATIFAPLFNSFDDFTSQLYNSSDSQSIVSTRNQNTIDSIKLIELESMLSDISNKYGKSSQAQLYLEKEIYALSSSVKSTTSKTLKRNLYAFTKTLKETESTSRQCKTSIPL